MRAIILVICVTYFQDLIDGLIEGQFALICPYSRSIPDIMVVRHLK